MIRIGRVVGHAFEHTEIEDNKMSCGGRATVDVACA